MSTIIKNTAQLKKILKQRINQAMWDTKYEFMNILQKHIDEYYDDYEPRRYERTYMLMLESILDADVEQKGNNISVRVGIDEDYLNYRYNGKEGITGRDVFTWASGYEGMAHIHGYTVSGNVRIWEDAMDEIGREKGLLEMFKKNLRKNGVPVK